MEGGDESASVKEETTSAAAASSTVSSSPAQMAVADDGEEDETTTARSTPVSSSHAASALGRRICVFDSSSNSKNKKGRNGVIVAYDPATNRHTVRFDPTSSAADCSDDADEPETTVVSLVLNQGRFRWLVQPAEAAENWKERLERAVKRDAVGRRVEVWSKQFQKWFSGTIMAYMEEHDKHRIQFEAAASSSADGASGAGHHCQTAVRLVRLEGEKWRYTDLIGEGRPKSASNMTLATSRYMGVRRSSDSTWTAKMHSKETIGTFASEKDAALAYDVFARKSGVQVNFQDEQITEEEMNRRKTTGEASLTSRTSTNAASKYRGVHWQKNRKRWMARYSLQGGKHVNLGAFLESRQAALAFDAEARRRGRLDSSLNFPNEHPTDDQIDAWNMNTAHYSMTLVPWPEKGGNKSQKTRNASDRVGEEKKEEMEANDDSSDSHQDAGAVDGADSRDSDAGGGDGGGGESSDAKPAARRDNNRKKVEPSERRCRYPVGTRFVKEFDGDGVFEGEVRSFDGVHYHVHYPADGDEEELSEYEFDDLDITHKPGAKASPPKRAFQGGSGGSITVSVTSTEGSVTRQEQASSGSEEDTAECGVAKRKQQPVAKPAKSLVPSGEGIAENSEQKRSASQKRVAVECGNERQATSTPPLRSHLLVDDEQRRHVSEESRSGATGTILPASDESAPEVPTEKPDDGDDNDNGAGTRVFSSNQECDDERAEESASADGTDMLAQSNAASVVGRQVSILSWKSSSRNRDGVIVAYDPISNLHTVRFDGDGEEKAFVLNQQRFKWIVQPTEAADDGGGRKERFRQVVMRDAVGRRLKVWSEKNQKWFEGRIIGFSEMKGKHRIQFDTGDCVKSFRLEKQKWRYTDLVGDRSAYARCALSTSKYMGVRRISETRWLAFEKCSGNLHIGTFSSEKDAALARDVFARKSGLQVNFDDERITEEDIKGLRASQSSRTFILDDTHVSGGDASVSSDDRGGHQSAARRVDRKAETASSKADLRYPLGTRLKKEFPGHGFFEGEVTSFDGRHYNVCYPDDGDEEELSEWELDNLEIIHTRVVDKEGKPLSDREKEDNVPVSKKSEKLGEKEKQASLGADSSGRNDRSGTATESAGPKARKRKRDNDRPKISGAQNSEQRAAEPVMLGEKSLAKKKKKAAAAEALAREGQDAASASAAALGHQKPVRDRDVEAQANVGGAKKNAQKARLSQSEASAVTSVVPGRKKSSSADDLSCARVHSKDAMNIAEAVAMKKARASNENSLEHASLSSASTTSKAAVKGEKLLMAENLSTNVSQAKPAAQLPTKPVPVKSDSDSPAKAQQDAFDGSSVHNVSPAARPRYPVGTCFMKEFTGHGAYVGRVVGYDGKNYRVCYEEVVNEEELASFDITHIPSPKLKRENSAGAQAPCKKKVKSTIL